MLHVATAIVSYSLFLLRGIWMLRDSPMLAQTLGANRAARQRHDPAGRCDLAHDDHRAVPGTSAWLTAKVIGLIVYILIGTVALRRGPTKAIRMTAWIVAQLVFFYIVAVALTRNANPFAGW